MQGGSHSTVVIWLVAAVLAVLAGMRLLGGGDGAAPAVRVDGADSASARRGDPSAPAPGDTTLYVHVAGAMRRPGLIRLPSGARVATALRRAGGPGRRADLTLVNLAARV